MKKKLYDFSIANAVTVLIAYGFLLTLLLYNVFTTKKNNWVAIVILVLLTISLALVIWYFVYLAVTITEKGIKHGHKFISKYDAKWEIKYNRRYRYSEIIFKNKYIDYKKLDKKEVKKKVITVQYFPKYEHFLTEYFSNSNKKGTNGNEKKES